MRITVNGKRAEISVGRQREAAKWNSGAGRVIGTKEEIRTLNSYLDQLTADARKAYHSLVESEQTVTASSLRNELTGNSKKELCLLNLFSDHNRKMKALIGNGFTQNTLKGYLTSEKHLADFIQQQYLKNDFEINNLNFAFINDYEHYLKTDKKRSSVSAAKYIKHLKKVVNHLPCQ